jgi:tetrahydromethanopterin S-methyltransferase subunit A
MFLMNKERWPKIEGEFVSGNKEDEIVVRMLQAMLASGVDPEKIKRMGQKKGVILVK